MAEADVTDFEWQALLHECVERMRHFVEPFTAPRANDPMNTIRSILLFGFLAFAAAVHASTVVEMQAEGYLGAPVPANIVPIFAAIVSEHDFKVVCGTKLNHASVYLGGGAAPEIVAGLKKFDGWAAKAKEIEFESSKELVSFSGLRLVFISSAKGAESHLEMELVDFDSERRLVIRLEGHQVPKLIEVLERVPEAFVEFRKQQEKAKQLQ